MGDTDVLALEVVWMAGATFGVETSPGFVGRAQVPRFEGEPVPSPKKGPLVTPGFIGVAQAHRWFEGEVSPQEEEEG